MSRMCSTRRGGAPHESNDSRDPRSGDSGFARQSDRDGRGRAIRCDRRERQSAVRRIDRFARSLELRDGDPARYAGKGVRKAVENVTRVHRAGTAGRECR